MSRLHSRRGWLRMAALALPVAPAMGCGTTESPLPLVPPGYEADAALLESYYGPELIPYLRAVGMQHVSGRGDAEVQGIYEESSRMLRDMSFEELDEQSLEDFRSLRVEDVAGWTLSWTETRLAVLSLALP